MASVGGATFHNGWVAFRRTDVGDASVRRAMPRC